MEYLVINALGSNQANVLNELVSIAAKSDCNIEESRMSTLGSETAIMILVSGNWNTIAKMEGSLTHLEKEKGIVAFTRRTKLPANTTDLMPYIVQIVGVDHSGIIYEISNFFVQQNIVVNDMQSATYASSLSGTLMLSLMMRIGIPTDTNIASFREQFSLLCDDLNLDGLVEPEKN